LGITDLTDWTYRPHCCSPSGYYRPRFAYDCSGSHFTSTLGRVTTMNSVCPGNHMLAFSPSRRGMDTKTLALQLSQLRAAVGASVRLADDGDIYPSPPIRTRSLEVQSVVAPAKRARRIVIGCLPRPSGVKWYAGSQRPSVEESKVLHRPSFERRHAVNRVVRPLGFYRCRDIPQQSRFRSSAGDHSSLTALICSESARVSLA
jgi:hypothetical protein